MLRSRLLRWTAAALAVGLVAAAGTAVAQDRLRTRREGVRAARFLKARALQRRTALRRLGRLVDMPEEQARTALEVAREAGAVRAAARDRAAAILVGAYREGREAPEDRRPAIRERVREELRAVKEEAKAALLPVGRKAVAALTPEQRAKIEGAAEARGRTLDDARLALLLAWRLSGPRAESFLKARLGR